MRLAALALLAPLLAACGGGGGGGPIVDPQDPPPDPPTSGVFAADLIPMLDFTGFTIDGRAPIFGQVRLGDKVENQELRGYFSFAIDGLPDAATIDAAELRLVQLIVTGNPYTDFPAGVLVDHVDLGAEFEVTDHTAQPLATGFGTMAPVSAVLETKTLTVTSQVAADHAANRTRSSFRLRFPGAPSLDAIEDQIRLGITEPQAVAKLFVTYTVP